MSSLDSKDSKDFYYGEHWVKVKREYVIAMLPRATTVTVATATVAAAAGGGGLEDFSLPTVFGNPNKGLFSSSSSSQVESRDPSSAISGQSNEDSTATSKPNVDSAHTDKVQNNFGAGVKKRHRESRVANDERLCSFVMKSKPCPFLPNCVYLHDTKQFLENKPPDLGDRCYVFETFGNIYSFYPNNHEHSLICSI